MQDSETQGVMFPGCMACQYRGLIMCTWCNGERVVKRFGKIVMDGLDLVTKSQFEVSDRLRHAGARPDDCVWMWVGLQLLEEQALADRMYQLSLQFKEQSQAIQETGSRSQARRQSLAGRRGSLTMMDARLELLQNPSASLNRARRRQSLTLMDPLPTGFSVPSR